MRSELDQLDEQPSAPEPALGASDAFPLFDFGLRTSDAVAQQALTNSAAAIKALLAEHEWLSPLFASCVNSFSTAPRSGMKLLTQWSPELAEKEDVHLEKARLYSEHVRSMVKDKHPWLLPMLEGAGALVCATPGRFNYLVPEYPGAAIDIPELRALTLLTPFAASNATIN